MSLGEKIRKRRRELDMTQEALGDLLNVHENTIRKWEKGISSPSAKELENLSHALRTTIEALCSEADNQNFMKSSEYQDRTEINNNVPSMAYWGSLVDNAEKAAESGKNISAIITLVKTALQILEDSPLQILHNNETYVELGA